MKTKIIQLLLFVIAFSGCQENQANKENSEKKSFDCKVEITTENISDNSIRTKIQTNFPENTPFTITVSREYIRKNNPLIYEGQLYYSYTSFVKNGEICFDFIVNDKKWIDEYYEIKKASDNFDKTLTDIETIKDTLTINVLYTPKAESTKEIKDILGENGENMTGKEVEKLEGAEGYSDFYVFNKSIKLYNKLKK